VKEGLISKQAANKEVGMAFFRIGWYDAMKGNK
jgi:hypothetical protein